MHTHAAGTFAGFAPEHSWASPAFSAVTQVPTSCVPGAPLHTREAGLTSTRDAPTGAGANRERMCIVSRLRRVGGVVAQFRAVASVSRAPSKR